jgi:hypothetical protein
MALLLFIVDLLARLTGEIPSILKKYGFRGEIGGIFPLK